MNIFLILFFHLYQGIHNMIIVDVNWRLDYAVRSKYEGRENKPIYFVTLRVKDCGLIKDIEMIANYEELQYFYNKIRDSIKQVDRLLNRT